MITILAVDDSVTIRNLIKAKLSQNPDFQIELAEDGKQGIAMAKSLKPDLILLDFILPDCKGNMVCANLLNDSETKNIPIILLSSNADDIAKTKAAYPNVVKTLLKPFNPPLLSATVNAVLKSRHIGTEATSSKPENVVATPLFAGSFNFFSPISVLEAIDLGNLTGVLKVMNASMTLEFYFFQGRPLYGISKDIDFYLKDFPYPLDGINPALLSKAKNNQRESGYPLFISLYDLGQLELEGALTCAQEQSQRLFSQTWVQPTLNFEFTPSSQLPVNLNKIPFPEKSMDQWALESLRFVGKAALSLEGWGDSSGIPCFTRKGCDRVENVDLDDEEYAFASSVTNHDSLSELGRILHYADIEDIQALFFRFIALEIMDYWPASLAGEKHK